MPLLVEAGWGGLVQAPSTITWTDITTRVDVVQGVTISRGASDELSEIQPGTAVLVLDNQDGALTPGNSGSPYSPYVRKLAPIRISQAVMPTLSGSAPYPLAMLGDDFDDGRVNSTTWVTNTSGSGTETAEGRLRITVAPGVDTNFTSARQWTLAGSKVTAKLAAVPALNGSSNCAASMWVTSTTAGTRIGWRYDASTGVISAQSQTSFADGSAVNLTYSAIDHAWLRVRESGGTVTWETSSDGFIWTSRRTLATPSWVTSQTHALDFPTTRTGGTAGYIEWDLVGAEIRPRFWGVVNGWPVRWKGLLSKVTISCTDMLKRLSTAPELRSALAEEILLDSPGAYYPLTEGSEAASAGDISGTAQGALAMQQSGSGGTLEFGTGTGPPATGESSLVLTPASGSAGKYLRAELTPAFVEAGLARDLVIEAWFSTSTQGRNIVSVYDAGDLSRIIVYLQSGTGQLAIDSRTPDISSTYVLSSGDLADGNLHHVVVVTETGRTYVDGVDLGTAVLVNGFDYNRLVVGASHSGSNLWNGTISHVALYAGHSLANSEFTEHYTAGSTGFSGEAADDRIARLARYTGLSSVTVWGATHDPVASQGAAGANALARMREVETTEAAKLFAERDYYGFAYQSRDVRYNPSPSSEVFTIDYADLDTDETEASDDDQKMVNSVQASRPGGATQRVTAPASILAYGEKPQSLSILKTSDNSVLDAAAWLVSRYADPPVELREVPIEAHTMSNYLDILDADISSYFSVTNLPSQAPASSMRVTVEGYTETIKHNSHQIQFHVSKSATDSVWVLDDAVYSVLGSTTRLAY